MKITALLCALLMSLQLIESRSFFRRKRQQSGEEGIRRDRPPGPLDFELPFNGEPLDEQFSPQYLPGSERPVDTRPTSPEEVRNIRRLTPHPDSSENARDGPITQPFRKQLEGYSPVDRRPAQSFHLPPRHERERVRPFPNGPFHPDKSHPSFPHFVSRQHGEARGGRGIENGPAKEYPENSREEHPPHPRTFTPVNRPFIAPETRHPSSREQSIRNDDNDSYGRLPPGPRDQRYPNHHEPEGDRRTPENLHRSQHPSEFSDQPHGSREPYQDSRRPLIATNQAPDGHFHGAENSGGDFRNYEDRSPHTYTEGGKPTHPNGHPYIEERRRSRHPEHEDEPQHGSTDHHFRGYPEDDRSHPYPSEHSPPSSEHYTHRPHHEYPDPRQPEHQRNHPYPAEGGHERSQPYPPHGRPHSELPRPGHFPTHEDQRKGVLLAIANQYPQKGGEHYPNQEDDDESPKFPIPARFNPRDLPRNHGKPRHGENPHLPPLPSPPIASPHHRTGDFRGSNDLPHEGSGPHSYERNEGPSSSRHRYPEDGRGSHSGGGPSSHGVKDLDGRSSLYPPGKGVGHSKNPHPDSYGGRKLGVLKDPFHPQLGYPYYTDGTSYFFRIPADNIPKFLKKSIYNR